MPSLDERPEFVGFFSYAREDGADAKGALSALRDRIQRELRGQLGRAARNFRLWQDKEAIALGKLWKPEIDAAIAELVFFIPIITPTSVRSGTFPGTTVGGPYPSIPSSRRSKRPRELASAAANQFTDRPDEAISRPMGT